ncbi:hypothetical protein PG990_008864 [Apiospora arundinis]
MMVPALPSPDHAKATVNMVPWDAESQEHVEMLIKHRLACRWDDDKVAGPWRQAQREGKKCIFWLILPDNDPENENRLQRHLDCFGSEMSAPLEDTCKVLRGTPIIPSGKSFVPIGHAALDIAQPAADKFNLDIPRDGSALWIKSLWVSTALQSSGLGRAAMDTLEAMAMQPPLSATMLLLDTLKEEDQLRLRPYVKSSNQGWYQRRGYLTIHTAKDFYVINPLDFQDLGCEPFSTRTVFMRKDLA